MLNKKQVVGYLKAGGDLVASGGAQALACGLVRLVLPPGLSALAQGGMLVGGLILGGFVGDKLGGYVEEKIDETVKEFDKTVDRVKRDLDTLKDKENEENKEKEGELG